MSQNPSTGAEILRDNELLLPADLVKRWRNSLTTHTLAQWRSRGLGPAYIKIGRGVLYRIKDVEAYEAQGASR